MQAASAVPAGVGVPPAPVFAPPPPVPRSEVTLTASERAAPVLQAASAQQAQGPSAGPSGGGSGPRPRVLSLPHGGGAAHHAAVLESPVLLPMLPTEPSPTTGIPFPLPLFRGTPRTIAMRGSPASTPDAGSKDGPSAGGSPEGRKRRESQANVDGYQWKKYGEKNLKCSDTPRSYYKCSVPGCTAKKYVEYDPHSGQIAQTVIKGEHTHGPAYYVDPSEESPRMRAHKHQRRPGSGGLSPESCDGLLSIMEAAKLASDRLSDNDGATRSDDSADIKLEEPRRYRQQQAYYAPRGHSMLRAGGNATSSMDTDDGQPRRSSSLNGAHKRKNSGSAGEDSMEAGDEHATEAEEAGSAERLANGGAGAGVAAAQGSERRVVFHDTDAENVDDGYKWRKYGRKQVKNSSFPRNYYRCTTEGCPVKKHVERYSRDPCKLMVCYEYLPHSHEPPPDNPTGSRPPRRSSLGTEASRGGIISTRRQAAEAAKRKAPPDSAGTGGLGRAGSGGMLQRHHYDAFCSQPMHGGGGYEQRGGLHSLLRSDSGGGYGDGGYGHHHHHALPHHHRPSLLSSPGSGGMLSPHRIDLLASVVAQQEHLEQIGALNGLV